jgi:ATP-dependent DNA helicase RecQ
VSRLQRERNQKFGVGQSIDILLGRKTEKVVNHRHDDLSVFGVGTELKEQEWRGVARQLLAQGLLAVEGEYGVITLTDSSGEVLRRQRQVMLRREPERAAGPVPRQARSKVAAADLAPEAEPLFERLREWRASTAKEQGVPAYVIFHDATLRQIAQLRPPTLADLGTVSGVGENKRGKYGQQILAIVKEDRP